MLSYFIIRTNDLDLHLKTSVPGGKRADQRGPWITFFSIFIFRARVKVKLIIGLATLDLIL